MHHKPKVSAEPPDAIYLYWCPGCGGSSPNPMNAPVHFGVKCDAEPKLLKYERACWVAFPEEPGPDTQAPARDFAKEAIKRILDNKERSPERHLPGMEKAARIIKTMEADLDVPEPDGRLRHTESDELIEIDPYESVRYLFLQHEYRPQNGGYLCGCGEEVESAATHLADVLSASGLLGEEAKR